jgi:hypothetical protein
LADDANGGNTLTLTDTCAIERYYRVADRVSIQPRRGIAVCSLQFRWNNSQGNVV